MTPAGEYYRVPGRLPGEQRGVALAMVVWFLAAMSLLVMGIVDHAQVDVRMAQNHLARAKAAAAGDGAIRMMLLRYRRADSDSGMASSQVFRLGDERVRVEMTPAKGLLDLSAVPEPMLAQVLSRIGGLDVSEAQHLASNVVQLRAASGRSSRFESLEDVLRIPGFNRALLDDLRDSLRAVPGSGGSIDWTSAPSALYSQLQDFAPGRGEALRRRREGAGSSRAQAPSGGLLRMDALIEYGGRTWLRRRWVELGQRGRDSSLPWRVVRSEAPRVVSVRTANGVK